MKTQSLSPLRLWRLNDLISLADHGDRQQWHCLRCHLIRRGQFTASYADIARRWGVSTSVVYSTVKALIKMGYVKVERFEFASLFTILPNTPKEPESSKRIEQTEHSGRQEHSEKPKLKPKLKKVKIKVHPRSRGKRRELYFQRYFTGKLPEWKRPKTALPVPKYWRR